MLKHLRQSSNLAKYIVGAILLIIPIYPKFPFIDIPKTHVFIRLEDFLILLAGLVVLYFASKNIKKFLKDKINYSVLIFLVIGLISVASSILVTKTTSPTLAGY